MVKWNGHFMFAVCSFFVLSSLFAIAQNMPQPFSSDYSFTAEGSKPSTGKIYFSWPYYRQDTGNMRVITNYSTNISYGIFLDKHQYFETRASEYKFDAQNPCAISGDLTCKKIGPETVNGRACDKWETTDKKNGRPGSVCVDRELNYPISVHHTDGTAFDYVNIKPGPQPSSLFEIPEGYQKVPDPFGRIK
jgi:hypothetical protein